VVRAGDGRDVVDSGSAVGAVQVLGEAGDDQVVLGGSGSSAVGGDGDDAIDASGSRGASRIDGGEGADRLVTGGSGSIALGGPGADQLDGADTTGPTTLEGGPGADGLVGGDHADVLRGGDDDDRLDGGPGTNRLEGGAGQDVLVAGAAASAGEVLSGGEGLDAVTYENAAVGVRVSVGTGADDGPAGDGDDVLGDVERVEGSDGDDVLAAGPGGTALFGAEGDDRLLGGAARDELVGGPGDDRLDGGPGIVRDIFEGGADEDEITYGSRSAPLSIDMGFRGAASGEPGEGDLYRDAIERVVGGSGNDRIKGQSGVRHVIAAGAGNDVVRVREAPGAPGDAVGDSVRCQEGDDRVEGDRFDTMGGDCERVLEDLNLISALTVFPAKPRVNVSRDGRRLGVRIGCDRETLGYCSTKVVVRRPGGTRPFARVERVRILPGRYRTVRLKAANRRAAASLVRTKRVLVVVVVRDRIGRGTIAKALATRTRAGKPTTSRKAAVRSTATQNGATR
jgi:Ca2+-binding RTX toxin-like protein